MSRVGFLFAIHLLLTSALALGLDPNKSLTTPNFSKADDPKTVAFLQEIRELRKFDFRTVDKGYSKKCKRLFEAFAILDIKSKPDAETKLVAEMTVEMLTNLSTMGGGSADAKTFWNSLLTSIDSDERIARRNGAFLGKIASSDPAAVRNFLFVATQMSRDESLLPEYLGFLFAEMGRVYSEDSPLKYRDEGQRYRLLMNKVFEKHGAAVTAFFELASKLDSNPTSKSFPQLEKQLIDICQLLLQADFLSISSKLFTSLEIQVTFLTQFLDRKYESSKAHYYVSRRSL